METPPTRLRPPNIASITPTTAPLAPINLTNSNSVNFSSSATFAIGIPCPVVAPAPGS